MSASPKDRSGDRLVGTVIAAMNGAGSVLIIFITVMICADIVGRGLFSTPVAGVAEMVSLAIVAVVFLQLAQAVRSNALARSDLVLSAIQRRSAVAARMVESVYCLVAVLLFGALVYGALGKLADTWASNEHVGVYGLFVAPVWPISAIVVVGSAAAALQFALHAYAHFRAAFCKKAADK